MNKALVAIMTTVLLDSIGIGLIMPILPGLLHSLLGPEAAISTHYGALMAVYALMQFLCAPILGALSDRYGRRPVLLVSLAGAAADYLLMAAAPSLAWLYVGRVLAGVTGANLAVAAAYITDVTAEADRAKRFGQMGAAIGLGFVAGPLIGGVLGEWHLRAPFLAAAGMNGLNLLLACFVLRESHKPGGGKRALAAGAASGAASSPSPSAWGVSLPTLNVFASLRRLGGRPALMPLVGVYAVITLVSQAPATLWILYGQDRYGWTTTVAGISLAGYGALHSVSQAFAIGPVVSRLGERCSLFLGLGADGVGLVLLACATLAWQPFALLPLFAIGGMTVPALQAMISRQVSDSNQGELQGTLTSIASLLGVAGPIAVTSAYAATRQVWPGLVWVAAAALYLLVVPLLFNRRVRRGDAA